MKKLIVTPTKDTISLKDIDLKKHFIAFIQKDNGVNKGYFVVDDSRVSLPSLEGWANCNYTAFQLCDSQERIRAMSKYYDFFVFDNRREFFLWLAENSK